MRRGDWNERDKVPNKANKRAKRGHSSALGTGSVPLASSPSKSQRYAELMVAGTECVSVYIYVQKGPIAEEPRGQGVCGQLRVVVKGIWGGCFGDTS